MKRSKFTVLLALLLSAIVLFAGCSGKQGSTGTEGSGTTEAGRKVKDTVTVALYADPPTLDPQCEISDAARVVEWGIYDTLVKKDANGVIQPKLATKWEQLDDLTWRFYLRDDVTFHNGEKLTAEDVRFSINRATEMWGSAYMFSGFDGQNCAVVDEHTVDIKTRYPFAPTLNYLASSRGAILCKSAVESMGDDAYGAAPIGSGPLKLVSHTAGDSVVCERNDQYWGEKTSFKTIVYRVIPESSARVIELESGGVDVALWMTSTEMNSIEANPNTELIITPSYESFYMLVNATNQSEGTHLSDLRFRQALAYALDTAAIVKAVWGDTATPADSLIQPEIMGYYPSGPWEYSPEKAKALLDEMGFDYSTVIQLETVSGMRVLQESVEIIQNMLTAIGLNVQVTLYEEAAIYDRMYGEPWQLMLINDPPQSGDPDHSMMTPGDPGVGLFPEDDFETWNLIEKGRSTFDEAERTKVYEELSQRMWDSCVMIEIANGCNIYGVRKGVEGIDTRPSGIPDCSTLIVYEN